MSKRNRINKGSNKKTTKRTKYNRQRSPEYAEFRRKVLARDSYRCQYPGCQCNKSLEVHHIKSYAKHPRLRTEPYNGISLCVDHHKKVTGCEEDYENLFYQIIKNKAMPLVIYKKKKKSNNGKDTETT